MPLETIRSAVPQAGPPAERSYGGFRVYVAPPPMAGASALWPAGTASPEAAARRPPDSGGIAGLRGDRREGQRGGVQPVDGPALRRAHRRARAPASCSARRLPTARFRQPDDHRQSGQWRVHLRRRRRRVAVRRHSHRRHCPRHGPGQAVRRASVLAARAGRGGYVNAIVCPDGISSGGASCSGAIDPAGAGLALNATSATPHVGQALAPRRRRRSVHRHGRDGGGGREGSGAADTRHPSRGRPAQHAGAAARALARGRTPRSMRDRIGYVAALGMPALRERIARHYRERLRRRGRRPSA